MQKGSWRATIFILDTLTLAILTATYAAGAWAIMFKSPEIWVDHLYDDAYYYLGIVKNMTEGHGSMFLQPFATNGYQPLWTLLLYLAAKLGGTTERSLALQLYTCSFALAFSFAWLSRKQYGNAFLAVLCLLSFPYISLLGMETCLIPPLCLLFFQSRHWISRGVLASLIFLARLDALALVLSRDIAGTSQGEKRDFRHYLVVVPTVACYFYFNYKYFNTPVPISGLAKAVGNVSGENWGAALQYLTNMRYAALLLPIALAAKLLNPKQALPFKVELLTLLLSLLMCIAYYSIKSGWPIWGWYAWAAALITFFLTQSIIRSLQLSYDQPSDRWRTLGSFASILILVLTICGSAFPAAPFMKEQARFLKEALNNRSDLTTFGRQNVALAEYFRDKAVAPGTMFAMGDRAGSFGFFLGQNMQFMHTEGLVGPLDYVEAMQKDKGKAYIESLPISYYVADRERYLRQDGIIGVAEPNQGLSTRVGPYLLCFPESSIMLDQSYETSQRYVFDFKKQVNCPADMEQNFLALKAKYQGIRKFSQPTRYSADNLPSRLLRRHIDMP